MPSPHHLDEKVIRQKVAQIYNQVNQKMYGTGVRAQKVELMDDKILIFGLHKRVPALEALDDNHKDLTRTVDATLIQEFKARLQNSLEKELNLPIRTILKDFDPASEDAAAVIYLDKATR
ncbi:Na-translocating system protein MpsC family protein [Salsuginibacillus kocurii]|uniref:Na-translocating system protein MpsC family protein n=1 Tax=Salsuginibacillus kocurii TaxID=427078 RepID=UPI0003807147|nr:Na-translocating system protein MpsC family protein [Salsuginibacillus kocurii]